MSAPQRDELADEIAGHPIGSGYESTSVGMDEAREIADNLLAAGYRKVRTIETADELDALPEGTEIVDRYERLTLEEDVNGYHEWHDIHGNVCSVELPATVLSTPEATA